MEGYLRKMPKCIGGAFVLFLVVLSLSVAANDVDSSIWNILKDKGTVALSTTIRNFGLILFIAFFGFVTWYMSWRRIAEAYIANRLAKVVYENDKERFHNEEWNSRYRNALDLMAKKGTSGVLGLELFNTLYSERPSKQFQVLTLVVEYIKSRSNEFMSVLEQEVIDSLPKDEYFSEMDIRQAVEERLTRQRSLPVDMEKSLKVVTEISISLRRDSSMISENEKTSYISMAGTDLRWLAAYLYRKGEIVTFWRFDFSGSKYKVSGGLEGVDPIDCKGFDQNYFPTTSSIERKEEKADIDYIEEELPSI